MVFQTHMRDRIPTNAAAQQLADEKLAETARWISSACWLSQPASVTL